MKKILLIMLTLFLSVLLSSFASIAFHPMPDAPVESKLPDISSQKLYALMDELESYDTVFTQSNNDIVNKLAGVLASNIHIDYNAAAELINDDSTEIQVSAYIIDTDKVKLDNTLEFEFDTYYKYMQRLNDEIYIKAVPLFH